MRRAPQDDKVMRPTSIEVNEADRLGMRPYSAEKKHGSQDPPTSLVLVQTTVVGALRRRDGEECCGTGGETGSGV